MTRLPLLVPLVLVLPSCVLFEPKDDQPSLSSETAAEHMARAQADLDAGRTEDALDRLLDVHELDELPTARRHEVELLVETTAYRRLEELSQGADAAEELEDLFEEDEVPKRVRVSAGVAAARARLRDGEPLEAYEVIRRVDQEFPTHHERAVAGGIVAEAGFALARSDESYFFFFDFRDRAPEVLEYLVLNYPADRSCEEAYLLLASIYEEQEEWSLAQERHEDLLLYYPSSPNVPYSEARIPDLRMRQVVGPEYDRMELKQAERELHVWLSRHGNHPSRAAVEDRLAECKTLLIESDLTIASFYARVDEGFGVRVHAKRALDLAQEVGDTGRIARASDYLVRFPDDPRGGGGPP